jgi:hypothetical protein
VSDKKSTPQTVTVVMIVNSHGLPRGTKVDVDPKTAADLIEKRQAREA